MAYVSLPKKKDNRVKTTRVKEYSEVYQDPRWRMLRRWKFSKNPICENCEHEGKTTPTEEVHHIIRFADGRTKKEVELLAFSKINLRSLCVSCHKKAHEKYMIDYPLRMKILNY